MSEYHLQIKSAVKDSDERGECETSQALYRLLTNPATNMMAKPAPMR